MATKDSQREPGAGVEAGCEQDMRCTCHNLLARRRGRIVELKCRRCKRVMQLELTESGVRVLQQP